MTIHRDLAADLARTGRTLLDRVAAREPLPTVAGVTGTTIRPDRVAAPERIGRTRRDRVADLEPHLIAVGMTAMIVGETGIIGGATEITAGVTETAGEMHRVTRVGARAIITMAATGIHTGTTTAGTIAGAGT
jgi:hypothetical protein